MQWLSMVHAFLMAYLSGHGLSTRHACLVVSPVQSDGGAAPRCVVKKDGGAEDSCY